MYGALPSCYMDLLKLLRGFVNVFLCIAFAAGGERASPARQAAMVM